MKTNLTITLHAALSAVVFAQEPTPAQPPRPPQPPSAAVAPTPPPPAGPPGLDRKYDREHPGDHRGHDLRRGDPHPTLPASQERRRDGHRDPSSPVQPASPP